MLNAPVANNKFDNVRPITIKGRQKYVRSVIVSMDSVRTQFLNCVADNKNWPTQTEQGSRLRAVGRAGANAIEQFYGEYVDDETGYSTVATGEQSLDWTRNGYRSKLFRNIAEQIPVGVQHRPAWNEDEGDIEISRLYGGFDDFYLGLADRVSKPGIRIQFAYTFNCGVSNKVIAQYGAWIFGLIAGMESQGFDMTIDAAITMTDLYTGDGRGTQSTVLVRVKRPGQISNPGEWSVLFSPIGFRVLGFTAVCVAGDKIEKQATSYLGFPQGFAWDLKYDKDTSTVSILCNSNAQGSDDFPAEPLTQKAIEAGLLPDEGQQQL